MSFRWKKVFPNQGSEIEKEMIKPNVKMWVNLSKHCKK